MTSGGKVWREADRHLLTVGPMRWEELIAWIMPRLTYGQWQSKLAHRKNHPDYENRRGDDWAVGARGYAVHLIANAVRRGSWVRDGDMIRHRDWQPVGESFTIPTREEIDAATATGSWLARLATATPMQLAAIVATFVYEPGQGSRADLGKSAQVRMSANQFTKLRIRGLGNHHTVLKYLRMWKATGLPTPEPGQTITIPEQRTGEPEPAPVPTDFQNPAATKRKRVTLPPPDDVHAWSQLNVKHVEPELLPDLIALLTEYQRNTAADLRLRAVN